MKGVFVKHLKKTAFREYWIKGVLQSFYEEFDQP